MNSKHLKIIIPVLILVFLFLFPLLKPDIYFMSFLFLLFMWIALSSSWDIIGGYAGYLSFGHVAFFGIGAYASGILLAKLGLSPFYTCFIGGFLAAALAGIFGYPCLRLRGPYFCIATLCMALAIHVIVKNVAITGACDGMYVPSPPVDIFTNRAIFYEVMLALAVAIVFFSRWIEKSKLGLGLKSIREDEETAQTLGVNSTRLKMTAFMLSAFLVGVVGGIYAYYRSYLHPDFMFDTYTSIMMVNMALVGGSRSWSGPLIGAVILTVVNEELTAFVGIPSQATRIIFGAILVGVILFMPNGIMALISERGTARKKKGLASQAEI